MRRMHCHRQPKPSCGKSHLVSGKKVECKARQPSDMEKQCVLNTLLNWVAAIAKNKQPGGETVFFLIERKDSVQRMKRIKQHEKKLKIQVYSRNTGQRLVAHPGASG